MLKKYHWFDKSIHRMDSYETSKINTKRYKKIKQLLQNTYGYTSFKPKQYEIINRIVSGEDVCAILPTGYGKSITYQIPGIYLDKPAIIISPLISLMDDQRHTLDEIGITSCCYNSTVTQKSVLQKDILNGKYQFVYITPESLVTMSDFLLRLKESIGISLIAIDEAHCISSYGFDFRKAYRKITFLKDILPDTPILAVTATATKEVGRDICRVLRLDTDIPMKTSFDRPNLYIEFSKKGRRVEDDIVPIIDRYRKKNIIIYCLTKKETDKIYDILKAKDMDVGRYHSGVDHEEKSETHKKFLEGEIKIVVATIAFGMGINKSDVRVVIHYGSPKNIEGYYQEIGRAGRDGKKSYCYTFWNFRDFKIQEMFIHQSNADPAYKKTQNRLLDQMKAFVTAENTCQRKLLLEYFGDKYPGSCDFCGNCCTKHIDANKPRVDSTKQNVHREAKLIIGLIEALKKNFGCLMYINILRGSKNKKMTKDMIESKYYGKGKDKSVNWWKELIDNLVRLGYLQLVYSIGSGFSVQLLKVTQRGIVWASSVDLEGILDDIIVEKLDPISMVECT